MLSTHRLDQVAVAGQATVRHVGGDLERALITGVAGFIGSHLAAELLRQGWLGTGVDNRPQGSDPGAAENLEGVNRACSLQATVEPAEEVRPMNAVWMWVLPLPLHGRNGRLT